MAIHYSVESLESLWKAEEFIEGKHEYLKQYKNQIRDLVKFLDSIEINKQYFRTGIHVKNPKYKRKVYDDTAIIKQLKSSLNKMSSMNHGELCDVISEQLTLKPHLYPIMLQYTLEQSLLHHTYCKYYANLIELLHSQFNNTELLEQQTRLIYKMISQNVEKHTSEYSNLCNKNKQIDQLIGYSILISELELKGVVKGLIDPMIKQLLEQITSSNEDEGYKCILCVYNIFKILYTNVDIKPEYKDDLENLKSVVTSMKLKFKIMDILERR